MGSSINKLRIVMLIWDYWPGLQGGAERQARLVARELTRRGHLCEVVTAWTSISLPRRDDDEGILVRRVGLFVPAMLWLKSFLVKCINGLATAGRSVNRANGGFRKGLIFWLTVPFVWLARLDFIVELFLISRMGKISCDIMHLHEPSWLGGVAQLLSRWVGCAVVCQEATSPALPVIGYDTPFRRTWYRLRMKSAYIGMADYAVEQLLMLGIPSERIYLLPNGVEIPPESSSGMSSSNAIYVANFSQGAAWKAFDVLFDAWVLVARQMSQVRLYAVGGGDYTEWKRYLSERGVSDTVVFTGRVKDTDQYLSQSSIFLLPSRVEGMSNALLEAQMWGLACVVSDIPGNRAVVTNDINGIVVPVNQSQALADAIVDLLGNELLRRRLGKVARESAIRNFSIQSVVERLIPVYQDILTKRL